MISFRRSFKRFWRPLIGTAAAYAVAAQTLLLAFGPAGPVHANVGTPTFELCLHDAEGAPDTPAGNPGDPACTHCIACFAGSNLAIGPAPVAFQRIVIEISADLAAADSRPLRRLAAHSIASPRGPPLGA
jgi:hypothetical protein